MPKKSDVNLAGAAPTAAERRRNVRLAVALLVVALLFYVGFFIAISNR